MKGVRLLREFDHPHRVAPAVDFPEVEPGHFLQVVERLEPAVFLPLLNDRGGLTPQ